MSGIEVAGLALAVLGIVPVAILTATKLSTAMTAWKELGSKDTDDRAQNFYFEISLLLYCLQNTLLKLVSCLDLSSDLRQRLQGTDIREDDWTDPMMIEALVSKLNEAGCSLFYHNLGKAMQDFLTLLELDGDLLPTMHFEDVKTSKDAFGRALSNSKRAGKFDSTKLLKGLYERFKYHKREEIRKSLQKSLDKHISAIKTLFDERPEEYNRGVHVDAKPPPSKLRVIATSLFEAISRFWPCNCKEDKLCRPINLQEARLCLHRDFKQSSNCRLKFEVIFAVEHTAAFQTRQTQEPEIQWQECLIEYNPKLTLDEAKKSEKYINCLPRTLAAQILADWSPKKRLAMTLSNDNHLWREGPRPRRIRSERSVSLRDEMKSPKWALSDRTSLSVTLAHTILHLAEGPWLTQRWDARNIFFFKLSDGTTDYQRPYLEVILDRHSNLSRWSSFIEAFKSRVSSRQYLIPSDYANADLLALCVLLLEIYSWAPLEVTDSDFPPYGDRDPENLNTIFRAAVNRFELLEPEMQKDTMGSYWTAAIQKSLYPDFFTTGSSFTTEEVRTAMYQSIVAPLEKAYSDAESSV